MERPYLETDVDEVVSRISDDVQELCGKTILISGACGFLGSYFCAVFDKLNKSVLARRANVLAIDNFIANSIDEGEMASFESISFVRSDVTRPLAIDQPVHFVIHAAGIASPVWYRTHPLETMEAAVFGTRNILELARTHGASVLHFSSSEIYGNPDPQHVPTAENYAGYVSCRGPRACYDESKRLGETLCDIFHGHYGVRTVSVRPFNVYGPGMHEQDYRVLPAFASRLKAGLPLHVFGSGEQTRTFCYVTDAIVGFFLAMLKGVPGEAYNIGNPVPEISMRNLVERVCTMFGNGSSWELRDYPDGYPSNEPLRRCPDLTKARLHLGYIPRVDLETGLGRFLDWARVVYKGEAGNSAALLRRVST